MIKNSSAIYPIFLLCMLFVLGSCDSSSPTVPSMEEEEEIIPSPTPSTPQNPVTNQSTIAFYNVENLFDTEDDPNNAGDNEFLPSAAKAWTQERYEHKLTNIGNVLQGINFPFLVGLSEVENRKVLEDLTAIEALEDQGYQIVHEESPDHRGIDVALLYQADEFVVEEWETFSVTIDDPNIADFTTRDILLVTGKYQENRLHVLVNHWPSRSGGVAQTEFRRITVAERLVAIIKDIQSQDASARIIVMGDFNDEPTNKSIADVLNVKTEKTPLAEHLLYNCTSELADEGEGSYNYQGNWQMLDQIIVSGSLLNKETRPFVENFQVYQSESLLFTHPEYGLSPDRTYGGDNYFGGFSDHLPVFVEIEGQ